MNVEKVTVPSANVIDDSKMGLFSSTIPQKVERKTVHWCLSATWRIVQRLYLRTRREFLSAKLELQGPTEFNTVWKYVGSVGGFSTDRAESLILYCLAKNGPSSGVIVEVGSFLGRSTAFLASGSKLVGRECVIAIDPHRAGTGDPGSEDLSGSASTLPLFLHNLRRLDLTDWVTPLAADAKTATKSWSYGAIRLLFIDGLHTYEAVRSEIEAFQPYLSEQAVIVFDDYYPPEFPGVSQAVIEAQAIGRLPKVQVGINRYLIVGLKNLSKVVHN